MRVFDRVTKARDLIVLGPGVPVDEVEKHVG